MPRYNTKNKRGINFVKSEEEVKSERFTIKFTKGDFDRIMTVVQYFKLERMEFSRDAIMKCVEQYEKKMPKPTKGIQHPSPDAPVPPPLPAYSEAEQAVLDRYRQGESLETIAAALDYPLVMVKSIVERLG